MPGRSWPRAALACALLLTACTPAATPCRSVAECERLDGRRVSIVGVYRALPHPKGAARGDATPVLARVDLDAAGPYLEPFWSARAARDAAELRRLDGKRVRVSGVFHKTQPRNPDDPPQAEAMGGPCLSSVQGLALDE